MENEIVSQWIGIGIGIGIEIFLFLEFHLIITVVKVPHCLSRQPKNQKTKKRGKFEFQNVEVAQSSMF